jgi:hypothetical protein
MCVCISEVYQCISVWCALSDTLTLPAQLLNPSPMLVWHMAYGIRVPADLSACLGISPRGSRGDSGDRGSSDGRGDEGRKRVCGGTQGPSRSVCISTACLRQHGSPHTPTHPHTHSIWYEGIWYMVWYGMVWYMVYGIWYMVYGMRLCSTHTVICHIRYPTVRCPADPSAYPNRCPAVCPRQYGSPYVSALLAHRPDAPVA